MGACRADQQQIWGLVELIFLKTCSLSELIFGPNTLFQNWILADFQACEHEKLPNLSNFSGKFKTFVIFGYKEGFVELKYSEKGVLWSS